MRIKLLIILVVLSVFSGLLIPTIFHPRTDAPVEKAINTVVADYFSAWIKGAPELMYENLSAADQQITAKKEYIRQFQDMPVQPLQYSVKHIELSSPDSAQVDVVISWPDIEMDSIQTSVEKIKVVKGSAGWKIQE